MVWLLWACVTDEDVSARVDWDGDGFVSTQFDGLDCDDQDPFVNPDATEKCGDGLDNDCDGTSNDCGINGELSLSEAHAQVEGLESGDFDQIEVGDLNEDGYSDVALSSTFVSMYGQPEGSGLIRVLAGPIEGTLVAHNAELLLVGIEEDSWCGDAMAMMASSPPVLAIGCPRSDRVDTDSGAVYLFNGFVEGEFGEDRADVILVPVSSNTIFGGQLAAGGDLTGDGHPDLVVSAVRDGFDWNGSAYVFEGPVADGLDTDAAAGLIRGRQGDTVGLDIVSASDLDGDGQNDLLVSGFAIDGSDWPGAVWLAPGPIDGQVSVRDLADPITGVGDDYFGMVLAAGGDVDGDGHDDAALAALTVKDGQGLVVVLRGGPELDFRMESAWLTVAGTDDYEAVGSDVDLVDVSGSGISEVVVGAYGHAEGSGGAFFFDGTEGGVHTLDDARASRLGEQAWDGAGTLVQGGDSTGDGIEDVWVVSPGADPSSVAYLIAGGSF